MQKNYILPISILLFAAISVILLGLIRASDSGVVSLRSFSNLTNISEVNDSQAEGGSYLQFVVEDNPPQTTGFPAPGSNPSLKSVSFWESRFDMQKWNASFCDNPQETTNHVIFQYRFAYCIDSFTNVWRATDDEKYLDEVIRHTMKFVDSARPSSQLGSDAFGDKYLGWRTKRADWGGKKEVSLDEMYMWRYVTNMLRAMNERNLHTSAKYKDDYTKILNFTEVNIFEKWYERSKSHTNSGNNWMYRQNSNVASHGALIAANLSLITTNQNRKAQYEEVVYNINFDYPHFNTSLKEHLTGSNPAVWQQPWPGAYGPVVQDVTHANAEMSYLAESVTMGRDEWTRNELQPFINTVTQLMAPNGYNGGCSFYVDGSGSNRTCWLYDGFAKLGRFDANYQKWLEQSSSSPYHSYQMAAQLALNARYLGAPK